jgi:hypothetical protein
VNSDPQKVHLRNKDFLMIPKMYGGEIFSYRYLNAGDNNRKILLIKDLGSVWGERNKEYSLLLLFHSDSGQLCKIQIFQNPD